MRPSLDDWIVRECAQQESGFIRRCLWIAIREGSWRRALRLLQLLIIPTG